MVWRFNRIINDNDLDNRIELLYKTGWHGRKEIKRNRHCDV